MAYEVICRLKQENVEYFVAPYEADAQLAYLYKIGYIEAVISIDSDLLPFGCQTLLTKYSKGWCKEINMKRLNKNLNTLNFTQFNDEMFLQFCIFCGCDYLDSIPGIGPKTAHRYMIRGKKWQRVLKTIRFDGKLRIPKGYETKFQQVNYFENFYPCTLFFRSYSKTYHNSHYIQYQALYTFRHQRVYDPTHKRLVHLQPLPPDQSIGSDTDYLGPDMDPNIAFKIAMGVIDPISKKILVQQVRYCIYSIFDSIPNFHLVFSRGLLCEDGIFVNN